MQNPLNRPNDAPENPLLDMEEETTPLADGVTVKDKTVRNDSSVQGHLSQDELDPSGDREGAGAIDVRPVPPGGSTTSGYSASADGSGMQFSKESGRTYGGNRVVGKVVRPSKDEKLNKIYG